MTTQIKEIAKGNALARRYIEIRLSGKLTKEEYLKFIPVIENRLKEEDKINLLVVFDDFRGWEAGALWEDIKFDAKHFNDIGKLAIVGENRWEKGIALFCRPFTTAKVKYFEPNETEDARLWLEEV